VVPNPNSNIHCLRSESHADVVCSIAVSHHGKLFATGSHDTADRLWDATTQRHIGPTFSIIAT